MPTGALCVNMRLMNAVVPDVSSKTVRVQGGANVGDMVTESASARSYMY